MTQAIAIHIPGTGTSGYTAPVYNAAGSLIDTIALSQVGSGRMFSGGTLDNAEIGYYHCELLKGSILITDIYHFYLPGATGTYTGSLVPPKHLDDIHGAGSYQTATGYSTPGDAMALTSGERTALATALLDLADGIETGVTLRQSQRAMLAALAGKLSGAAGTTISIRDAANDTTDRIVATVDADGNRSEVTLDLD